MTAEFQAILVEADKEGTKTPLKKQKDPVASTGAPKRRKQPAKRRKSPTPSPSQSEGEHSESDSEFSTQTPEVTPPLNDYVPSTPPSQKTTASTPITIASCPLSVSSQPPTSIPVSIPIFTESTISPQASTAPIISINLSDTGANTLGFSSHVTPPISPIRTDDPDMIFVDDVVGFTYSPFQIRIDSEDEASAMKGELKSLHENIDQLILASKASSSEAYSKAAVEFVLERVTKEHAANTSTMTKVVSDSNEVCKSMTEKVDKLIANTIKFMEDYKTTYNSNTITVNKAIQNVGTMFKAERTNFIDLRKEFQSDNQAFQSSIDAKISKL
ncbi:unnamed protein product [Lactuca saligna]|uniref:Uncharacterized protein n=1 Tax=Lactuca saligna TaxID=75948 RepID=A0AA36EN87_LACSI|nr:unnamed protein product [Lactuca saligna]